MSTSKRTLVLGASENPERYSYMAVQRLRTRGHEVIAVGKKPGSIGDVTIQTVMPSSDAIDTITLYLQAAHQSAYYPQIFALQPKRIIFNPGTENPELFELAKAQGIECLEACTLVMLAAAQY